MKSIRTAFAALLLCCGFSSMAFGEDAAALARENQLKAAYLFNFLKFVDWPAGSARSELLVCVRGAGGVADALRAAIGNKRIGALAVAVRSLGDGEQADECNALYVGAKALHNGSLLTAEETTLPLLTVSDVQGFARRDGIIELVTDRNRLRFHINVSNARRAGLRVSAGLLQLAAAVASDGGK